MAMQGVFINLKSFFSYCPNFPAFHCPMPMIEPLDIKLIPLPSQTHLISVQRSDGVFLLETD
jgi:hypothetical protein